VISVCLPLQREALRACRLPIATVDIETGTLESGEMAGALPLVPSKGGQQG